MRVMLTLAPDRLDVLRDRVAACEAAGIDAIGIGDSPGYHDPYVALTVAAQAPGRARLGPMVTNVVTRAPQVTARALRSVEELAPGRVFAGMGAGDSALAGARAAPAGLAGFRAGLRDLREAWPAAAAPAVQPWRVVVVANGPRTLALGGAEADLVVSGAGIAPDAVHRARQAVATGAAAAGRAADSVPVWVVARVSIADDARAAVDELLPLLASGANHVFAVRAERDALAPDVAERVDRLRRGYDYGTHGRRTGNPNAGLVDDLGLRDVLAARFALAGPADRVADGLRGLAAEGVAGVVIPAVGLDVDRLIGRLGDEVLPRLRGRIAP
ncbi:LLM class flavin-dependent oxidoreductase [Dactylosporangium sp. CA-139066]|uniref:LLM class flavin-dependent oxidoreductase n=1 Tax=Dactylosporangium sp. CA-139066 TaxID=3239930 RepID=UPI003D8CF73D